MRQLRPSLATHEDPMNWQRPILLAAAVLFVTPSLPQPPDLDVGIPPGSPASWGRRFPAITPRRGPLFPITPGGRRGAGVGKANDQKKVHTVVQPASIKMDVNIATSFGVTRIITWDLAGHLTWVSRTPRSTNAPVTGPSGANVKLPYVTDGLYWANMASLLRLMLHPQMVSEKELIGHLVEIGEPLIEVLNNSVSEASLVPPSKTVRKMVTAPPGTASPLTGTSPRETMLKRFLAEELVDTYPYDPEGGFGRRFFLFAQEVEPYLIEYAEKHNGSFLRRNAVAAVGRYQTDKSMSALGRVAATTTDPVVLMRSLAAVGAYRSLRDRAPILDRMRRVKDPVERIAFVVAAGRMGLSGAVPDLLELGGRVKDPDMIQAVVAALCRISHAPGEPSVAKFAKRMVRSAGKRPERFRVKARSGPRADVPDPTGTRGQIIHQLALLLQVRLNGKDKASAAKQVLGWIEKPGVVKKKTPARRRRPGRGNGWRGPRGRPLPRTGGSYANTSMRRVFPPVQMLFLETLRLLGEPGKKGLERIAKDRSVDPMLRGHALSQLPWTSRGTIAAAIIENDEQSIEAQIYGIEVVANDGHDRLEKIARMLLGECGKAKAKNTTPSLRYLWLQAIRALDRRHLLKAEDLLPLMQHVKARKVDSETLKQRVRNLVEALVRAVSSGLGPKSTTKRIHHLLDFLKATGLNSEVLGKPRKEVRQEIVKRLAGLTAHKSNRRYQNNIAKDIVRYLTGFRMGMGLQERTQFKPVVMLEEEILLALGRTNTKPAWTALADFLKDHPSSPLCAHAALALGMTGELSNARHLVPVLQNVDGFTRFCAYEGLRHLTGKPIWADWMYGDETTRNLAAAQYRKLVGK
jgi:hypothetical protein